MGVISLIITMAFFGSRVLGQPMRGALHASARATPFARPEVFAPAHARCASLKDIKSRLKAVTNTRKITKAMKMVAASKLRGAQTRMEMSRPFAAGPKKIVGACLPEDVVEATAESEYNQLITAISSDKGLCGGVNSSIVKQVKF